MNTEPQATSVDATVLLSPSEINKAHQAYVADVAKLEPTHSPHTGLAVTSDAGVTYFESFVLPALEQAIVDYYHDFVKGEQP